MPGDGSDEIDVGEERATQTGEPDGVIAKRLNVLTGRTRKLSEGLPRHVMGWWFEPGGEPEAVMTQHQGRVAVHWRDAEPPAGRVLAEADGRLSGHVNQLDCRPCSGPAMTVVVRSWSDRDPGQVWVHWPAEKRWRPVGAMRSGIDPARMARTDFHRVRARDGLEFPVWITRPAGAAAGPQPAVVLVHGGPWVRGRHWQWNAHAQFLASRGCVVIEPEFRGSRGCGQRLFRAGWRP